MGATLKLSTWNRAFRALKGLAGTALPQAAVVAVRCSSAGRASALQGHPPCKRGFQFGMLTRRNPCGAVVFDGRVASKRVT